MNLPKYLVNSLKNKKLAIFDQSCCFFFSCCCCCCIFYALSLPGQNRTEQFWSFVGPLIDV